MGTCYFSFFLFFFKRGRRLLVSSWLFRQAPSSIGTTTLFMLGSFSGRITSSWAVVSGSAHDYTSQRTPKRRSSCFVFHLLFSYVSPLLLGKTGHTKQRMHGRERAAGDQGMLEVMTIRLVVGEGGRGGEGSLQGHIRSQYHWPYSLWQYFTYSFSPSGGVL